MSQITRCPFCETTFRVVADQLRISDGWVRCGQCKEVFDASEHLLAEPSEPLLPDMPLDELRAPPAPVAREHADVWSSPRPGPGQPAPEPQHVDAPAPEPAWNVPHAPVPPFLVVGVPGEDAVEPAAPAFAPLVADAQPEGPTSLSALLAREAPQESDGYELPGAQLDDEAEWPQEPEADDGAVQAAPSPLPDPAQPDEDGEKAEPPLAGDAPAAQTVPVDEEREGDAPPTAEPGFVKAARRDAYWRRPAVRAALACAGLALAAVLGLQVAVQERDVIAARFPAMRPVLAGLCAPLGCTLQAPRRIAAVVIDSSSFFKARNDASAYQLQVSIKNTSALTVAMPALELTLTDAQDQPVLRRVLPGDELAAPASLAPGAVWSGGAALQVAGGAAPVAGYRLLAFYP